MTERRTRILDLETQLIEAAYRISITSCLGCDNIHLWFHDLDGRRFATATIGLAQLDAHIAKLHTVRDEILNRPRSPS